MSAVSDMANGYIKSLRPYVPGKPASWLEKHYGIKHAVKLSSNENPLGPSPKVMAMLHTFDGDLAQYPDGSSYELTQALAEKHQVLPEQITIGSGSEEIIRFVIQTFAKPGEQILVPEYSFIAYELCAKSMNVEVVKAPLTDWQVDSQAIIQAVNNKTKVIFIANPGNPTGTYINPEQLASVLNAVSERVIVVVDEAYFEYMTQADYPQTEQLLKHYPNLVIMRTFSKAYGLAGLRIGYSLSNSEVANLFNRIRFPFNTNTLAQKAAFIALTDKAHIEQGVQINEQGRQQYTEYFASKGIKVISKAANFVTIDLEAPAKPINEALLKHGIIVRDLYPYGLEQLLRITIGTQSQNQACIEAFEKVLTRRDS